jgi:hypothetical protein
VAGVLTQARDGGRGQVSTAMAREQGAAWLRLGLGLGLGCGCLRRSPSDNNRATLRVPTKGWRHHGSDNTHLAYSAAWALLPPRTNSMNSCFLIRNSRELWRAGGQGGGVCVHSWQRNAASQRGKGVQAGRVHVKQTHPYASKLGPVVLTPHQGGTGVVVLQTAGHSEHLLVHRRVHQSLHGQPQHRRPGSQHGWHELARVLSLLAGTVHAGNDNPPDFCPRRGSALRTLTQCDLDCGTERGRRQDSRGSTRCARMRQASCVVCMCVQRVVHTEGGECQPGPRRPGVQPRVHLCWCSILPPQRSGL